MTQTPGYTVILTSPDDEDLGYWFDLTRTQAVERYNALASAEVKAGTGNAITVIDPSGVEIDL